MKNHSKNLLLNGVISSVLAVTAAAEPSKNFKIFLCFGQSNMEGAVTATEEDKKPTPRTMALAFNDCSNPSWKKDTWVPAQEPLHCGDGASGNSMGPAYAFARVMADSLPNDTIGIIACGQSGVNIEYFMKGGSWNSGYRVPYPGGTNVWDWMLKKCKLAQQRGVFAGIILHQGESNAGQQDWPTKVNTILKDLKKECNLPDNLPFVAGELLYDKPTSTHNAVIAKIPTVIPNSFVASAQGLGGIDQFHFTRSSYLTLGARFAQQMMKGIRVFEKTGVAHGNLRSPRSTSGMSTTNDVIKIYTLGGQLIFNGAAGNWKSSQKALNAGNLFIMTNGVNQESAKLMITQEK